MSNRIVSLFAVLSALAALPLSIAPAQADKVRSFTCFGTAGGAVSCVKTTRKGSFNPHIITVPEPDDEDAAEERDKRWVARCRPRMRHDEYGVPYYVYAARGCEYGRID